VVIAWLLFPLVMLVACLGCGLAIERIGGWRLSGPVLLAVGLALVIVLATLTTARSDTASWTTWVLVAVAVLGYLSSWRRLGELRFDGWGAAVGVGLYVIAAAPVVLSGQATFLGYFVDSDTAFHLVLISELLAHGRDLSHVAPISSGNAVAGVLHQYVGTAYPTGADVGVGALRPLIGQDVAWIYQPYLAVMLALGGLVLDELLTGVASSRALRAGCAFVTGQAGLIYAFYLQGGIKEIAIVLLISLTALLVVQTLRRPLSVRALTSLSVVAVAELDVYSIAVVPWLGPPLAVFAVAALVAIRRGRVPRLRRELLLAPVALVLLIVLALPVINGASTFTAVASSVLSAQNELGDLAAPLSLLHVFGIWPSGDFRYSVQSARGLSLVPLFVAVAGFLIGTVWIVRRRSFAPLVLLGGDVIAAAYLLSRASPYAASKVMMILSAAVVLTAMLGAVALHEAGRRRLGWALAAVIGAGVLWTTALAYHDAAVLPRAQFQELADIGSRYAGRGPAFYDLWDTFAVYFLREESVNAPNTFAGPARLIAGQEPRSPNQLVAPWDPDVLLPAYLQRFPLLVLDRSPLLNRPPANYALVFQGRWYDVWERRSQPAVLEHIPLSVGGPTAVARTRCPAVRAAAARATRLGARLAYVRRPSLPTLIPTDAKHTAAWTAQRAQGEAGRNYLFLGQSSGQLSGIVTASSTARYRVWLQGSLSRPVDVTIDGQPTGSVSDEIGAAGQFNQLGWISLSAGTHRVTVTRPASGLGPGNVASGELLGPLVLVPAGFSSPVRELAPSQARALCGQQLEWLEVVR
jgi:hypothetical protein